MESKLPNEGARTLKGGLVKEVGAGFGLSTAGGFAYYLVKGFSNNRCFKNAIRTACLNAPRMGLAGGAFAMAAYSMTTGIDYFRKKNDKLDIIAGSAAGGAAVNARHGFKSASCTAIGVATVLTLMTVSQGQGRNKNDHLFRRKKDDSSDDEDIKYLRNPAGSPMLISIHNRITQMKRKEANTINNDNRR